MPLAEPRAESPPYADTLTGIVPAPRGVAVAPELAAPRASSDAGPGRSTPRRRWTPRRLDLAAYGVFLLAALWVTSRIWIDPDGRVAALYSSDPAQVQFFLAHSVRVVLHGEFPFFTDRFNYPDG